MRWKRVEMDNQKSGSCQTSCITNNLPHLLLLAREAHLASD